MKQRLEIYPGKMFRKYSTKLLLLTSKFYNQRSLTKIKKRKQDPISLSKGEKDTYKYKEYIERLQKMIEAMNFKLNPEGYDFDSDTD